MASIRTSGFSSTPSYCLHSLIVSSGHIFVLSLNQGAKRRAVATLGKIYFCPNNPLVSLTTNSQKVQNSSQKSEPKQECSECKSQIAKDVYVYICLPICLGIIFFWILLGFYSLGLNLHGGFSVAHAIKLIFLFKIIKQQMPKYQNGYAAHGTAQTKSLIGKDACRKINLQTEYHLSSLP